MANFRFALRRLGPLAPPLSGGRVHRYINRGSDPKVYRAPVGMLVYTTIIDASGGPQGRLFGGTYVDNPLLYSFAWSDNTPWQDDEDDSGDIYWTDQVAP